MKLNFNTFLVSFKPALTFFHTLSFVAFASLSAQVVAGPWEDLLAAIKKDNASEVSKVILRGADPNVDLLGEGPMLFVAVREQSWTVAKNLIELKLTDVNGQNKVGENALMLAAFHGNFDLVKALVKRGADINKPNWSALHYAAAAGHLSIVEYLVENNAYIDAESANNTTPLMMAARHKHITVMRWLTENGADPTYVNQQGFSAASYMKRYGETEQEAWLLKKRSEFEAKFGTRDKPKVVESADPEPIVEKK